MKTPIAAILAGGLGTRLRPLTYKIPKPLVRINRKPFFSYLLSKLSSLGIREVVLLVGYKASMIRKYCGDGKKWGLKIVYSEEKEPLGTGGALLNAFPSLPDRPVLLLNGDTYFNLDLKNLVKFHNKKNAWITLYAMEGELSERGAVTIEKNYSVKEFSEKQKNGFGLFNAGAYLIEPAAIKEMKKLIAKHRIKRNFSIEKDVLPFFAAKRKLFAYIGHGYFLDIGTHRSLIEAKEFFKYKEKGRAAIFLDRDGVINRYREDYVKTPEEFVFEENALEGLEELSKLDMPIFIVTNQSVVGRKIISKKMLKKIHEKMLSAFARKNIKISGIFVCPHRPEENCSCRKPKPGMLFKIRKKFGIDLSSSYLISDSSADILMGNSVGCMTILLKKGLKGKDGTYKPTPSFVADDLLHAAMIIKSRLRK